MQKTFKIGKQEYIVYSEGKIYSAQKNRILGLHDNSNGYLYVKLWDGSKTIQKGIHTVVAQFFIPNPYNLPEVNHLDGIKAHNDVSNLEWCTHKENMEHARKTGLFIQGEINKRNNQKTWIGQKNSSRTIIGLTDIKNKASNYKVKVRCDCGNELLMYHNDFRKGNYKYCKECSPRRLKNR